MSDKQTKKERLDQERSLDEALEDTFPASDPISQQQIIIVGRAQKPSFSDAPRVKMETRS
jgi:hypothetical protein